MVKTSAAERLRWTKPSHGVIHVTVAAAEEAEIADAVPAAEDAAQVAADAQDSKTNCFG